MSSSGYIAWAVTAGEIPTTAYWNILGANDASFNTGNGFNDGIIVDRHLSSAVHFSLYEANPYKFRATMSADVSISNGVWTKAALNTTSPSPNSFDTGGNFDTTNYRFVCPLSGFYVILAQVGISTAGTSVGMQMGALYKNGSEYIEGNRVVASGSNTTLDRAVIASVLQLSANDYLELYGYMTDTTGRVIQASTTYMSGFLLCTS